MSLLAAVDSLKGILALGGSTELTVRNLFRWEDEFVNYTALTTTTASAEAPVIRVKQKCRLVGAWFCPAAAVTGAATNFFTLLLSKRTVALPGTRVNLITYPASSTPAGDAVAFASKDLYTTTYIQSSGGVPDSTFDFAEGDVLTFEIAKAGTGMTFPVSISPFVFEARD